MTLILVSQHFHQFFWISAVIFVEAKFQSRKHQFWHKIWEKKIYKKIKFTQFFATSIPHETRLSEFTQNQAQLRPNLARAVQASSFAPPRRCCTESDDFNCLGLII
jgi:hypothetical protein